MWLYMGMTLLTIGLGVLIVHPQAAGVNTKTPYRDVYIGITRQDMLNRICMAAVFIVLFAVAACRINVGNDYARYVEFMHLVYSGAYVPTEVGFNLLTWLIYHLCGYENFLLVFAVFAFLIPAVFLAAFWQQADSFTWTFAMFMLLGYYFQSISTVRYYLALGIAVYSIRYVIERDWPRFVLLILIGSTFHKSLLVVLVLYVLAQMKWKKWMAFAGGCLCITFVFLRDQYLQLAVWLYPSYKNTEYLSGGTSYVNIARCIAVLILSLLYYRQTVRGNRRIEFYFHCNILALVLYVFCSFLPVISRIGYYLTVTQILFIPAILLRIPEDRQRKLFKALTILACAGYFIMYMRHAGDDGVRILPYQTFMFHDMPPILSDKGY